MLEGGAVIGGEQVELAYDVGGLSDAVKSKFPHLAGFSAFKLPDGFDAAIALKGQIAVSSRAPGNVTVDATGVQIPGVLDALFAYNGDLGVVWNNGTPTLRLWAPTATSVKLYIFDTSTSDPASQVIEMTANESGTWSAVGDAGWTASTTCTKCRSTCQAQARWRHNLVTDPYSVSLSMNSTRSQIVNLEDPALKPAGWDGMQKPALVAPEDITLYELHVRDFSARDASVPDELKGTFKAFTCTGQQWRQTPRGAGRRWTNPRAPTAQLRHRHDQRGQKPVEVTEHPCRCCGRLHGTTRCRKCGSDQDGYNWGYDPYPLHRARRHLTPPIPTARHASSNSARWSRRSTRWDCAW